MARQAWHKNRDRDGNDFKLQGELRQVKADRQVKWTGRLVITMKDQHQGSEEVNNGEGQRVEITERKCQVLGCRAGIVPGLALHRNVVIPVVRETESPAKPGSRWTVSGAMKFPRMRVMAAWGKHNHGTSVIFLKLHK